MKKYLIKKLYSVGNPDRQQYASISDSKYNVKTAKLSELRDKVREYIEWWNLGSGNFPPPNVYRNNKLIGHFSYNGRFWRSRYHENYCK